MTIRQVGQSRGAIASAATCFTCKEGGKTLVSGVKPQAAEEALKQAREHDREYPGHNIVVSFISRFDIEGGSGNRSGG